MDTVYTHPGSVHSDEVIATAIILYVFYRDNLQEVTIKREEPPEDIKASDWVIDQGKVYRPLLRQIDHHQLTLGDECDCTFSLLLKSLGYDEAAKKYLDWYTNFIILDSKGPEALAKVLETDVNIIYGLQSPVDVALKEEFRSHPNDDMVKRFLLMVGKDIIQTLDRYIDRMKELDKSVEIVELGKHDLKAALFLKDVPHPSFGIRQWLKLNNHDVAISVSFDERGGGWSAYRFNDHPKIDFMKIKKEKDVTYVPNTGFVAKIKSNADSERILQLLGKSVLR